MLVPTYCVAETAQEYLGNGNILVRNYSRRNGILVHEFNGIIASADLAICNEKFTTYLQAMIEREAQWRSLGMKVH